MSQKLSKGDIEVISMALHNNSNLRDQLEDNEFDSLLARLDNTQFREIWHYEDNADECDGPFGHVTGNLKLVNCEECIASTRKENKKIKFTFTATWDVEIESKNLHFAYNNEEEMIEDMKERAWNALEWDLDLEMFELTSQEEITDGEEEEAV